MARQRCQALEPFARRVKNVLMILRRSHLFPSCRSATRSWTELKIGKPARAEVSTASASAYQAGAPAATKHPVNDRDGRVRKLFDRGMDRKSTLAAAALAALAMAAGCAHDAKTAPAASAAAKGECYGVNACKGTGECGGPGHSCAGQNSCKGQGWISLVQADCEGRHGTFKKG